MQKWNLYHFTRSEWNDSKKRDQWMELCKHKHIPVVWYYHTPKKAYVYYDTESFGYELYDGLLLRNPQIVMELSEGVRSIYKNFWIQCIFTESPLRQTILVPKEDAEKIANTIYDFLCNFRDYTLK